MSITKKLLSGVLLLLLFVAVGCDQFQEPSVEKQRKNEVARVNGQVILRDDLARNLDLSKKKFRVGRQEPLEPSKLLWLKTNTLNQMIEEILFQQEAKRQKIVISEEEMNSVRLQFMEGYPPGTFEKSLEIVEVSQKDWERKLRNRLLIKKLIQDVVNSKVTISEEDVKRYFDEHPEEFKRGERIRALHILVTREELAQRVIKQLEKEADFSELARDFSESPEAQEGGDMGYIEKGSMPEEFDPVFKLKNGAVSPIMRTPYGFHVFKVVDHIPASQKSFEDSREGIYTKLLEESQEGAFRKWLEGIRKQAKIEIDQNVLAEIN